MVTVRKAGVGRTELQNKKTLIVTLNAKKRKAEGEKHRHEPGTL